MGTRNQALPGSSRLAIGRDPGGVAGIARLIHQLAHALLEPGLQLRTTPLRADPLRVSAYVAHYKQQPRALGS